MYSRFGATVRTHSHRRDGQFRLAYLESESCRHRTRAQTARALTRRGPVGRSLAPATFLASWPASAPARRSRAPRPPLARWRPAAFRGRV